MMYDGEEEGVMMIGRIGDTNVYNRFDKSM